MIKQAAVGAKRVLEFVVDCPLLAGLILVMLLANQADATPFLWVDTNNGNDSSADPFSPASPLLTYARAIELGAGDSVRGVKIKPGSALPTAEEAQIITVKKSDRRIVHHQPHTLIPGHGDLPTGFTIESIDAGVKVTVSFTWEVFTAPNGEQAERMISITKTVGEM